MAHILYLSILLVMGCLFLMDPSLFGILCQMNLILPILCHVLFQNAPTDPPPVDHGLISVLCIHNAT
jgi:hypothetical protein